MDFARVEPTSPVGNQGTLVMASVGEPPYYLPSTNDSISYPSFEAENPTLSHSEYVIGATPSNSNIVERRTGLMLEDEEGEVGEQGENPRGGESSFFKRFSFAGVEFGVDNRILRDNRDFYNSQLARFLAGRTLTFILFGITTTLFIAWQFFPLSTTLMVFMALSALVAFSFYFVQQAVLTNIEDSPQPLYYSIHLRLFLLCNAFFFMVDHLHFLQKHIRMLVGFDNADELYNCRIEACQVQSYDTFHVALYFPWFLIPLLIWGIFFAAHTLVHNEQFTWLRINLIGYVATTVVTYVFWWLESWRDAEWPYFLLPFFIWGAFVAAHALWAHLTRREGLTITIAGITFTAASSKRTEPTAL